MAWLRSFILGFLLGLTALGAWWWWNHGPARVVIDFVEQLDAASIRRPSPDVFAARDIVVEGTSRPSIVVHQPSRVAWNFTAPDRARVEVELALEPEAWSQAGDGVLFRIGVSYDGTYDELLTEVVNPFERAEHRRWVPVAVDLSPYAGRDVSLIFNTGPGVEGDNRAHDLAVWGSPRLVAR